jgi:hypothetical protein
LNLAELSFHDLQRLRAAVRRVHMKYYPGDFCTDREADRLIETLGEQTAQRMLKSLVDGKLPDGKLAR